MVFSLLCMAIYWPTPGLKGRTFKLCVLTRWDFNFCVRSSPLRDQIKVSYRYNILCYLYNVCACDQQYYYMVAEENRQKLWVKTLDSFPPSFWSLVTETLTIVTQPVFGLPSTSVLHLPTLLGLVWWYRCCAQNSTRLVKDKEQKKEPQFLLQC